LTKINLPPGCYGVEGANGQKYSAKPGGSIDVPQSVADRIKKSHAGVNGVLRGGELLALGTRRGRYCAPCRRWWQAWSTECPRCGEPTEAETETDEVNA
jgi:hypothetical protein